MMTVVQVILDPLRFSEILKQALVEKRSIEVAGQDLIIQEAVNGRNVRISVSTITIYAEKFPQILTGPENDFTFYIRRLIDSDAEQELTVAHQGPHAGLMYWVTPTRMAFYEIMGGIFL